MQTNHFEHFTHNLYNYAEAWCEVRVYHHEGRCVVLLIEPIDRKGDYASHGIRLVNNIENVVNKLRHEHKIEPDIVLEWHPERSEAYRARQQGRTPTYHIGTENFAIVEFKWDAKRKMYRDPQWEHVGKTEIEAFIGEALPAYPYLEPTTEESEE